MTRTTLKANGATYTIVKRETVEEVAASGQVNTACMMVLEGLATRIIMRRGNGKNIYQAHECTNGYQITQPIIIGQW